MTLRSTLVTAFVALLGLGGAWQIYSGWGLVSLDYTGAPLSKVLSAISRQGGIETASDLDPSTPVTIKVRRVPPVEALDIVAIRTDASLRLAYLGAPDEAVINNALLAFRSAQPAEGWTTHAGSWFNSVQPRSGAPLDLRMVKWQPEKGGALQDVLALAAGETGVVLAAPADWSPQVETPAGGRMTKAAPALFRQAGGVCREIFLLRGPAPGEEGGEDGGNWRGGSAWIGASAGDNQRSSRGRGFGDPESAVKRADAQIKLLPPEEQKEARDNAVMMGGFWQSVRDLPDEERRAKAREFFNRPEVQERMDDRRLAREARMTPEQRIKSSQRYWDRKAEAKYRGGTP
ncbi:MAG: hypothetical protein JHD33_02665 [Chthoniobacterales bacterium]|nr:hypothetical protein [Chthoniobacterales bacterium]